MKTQVMAAAALAAGLMVFGTPAWASLGCQNDGHSDVASPPLIANKGGATINKGSRIYYLLSEGQSGSFLLQNALQPGTAVKGPKSYHPPFFTCTASTSPLAVSQSLNPNHVPKFRVRGRQ